MKGCAAFFEELLQAFHRIVFDCSENIKKLEKKENFENRKYSLADSIETGTSCNDRSWIGFFTDSSEFVETFHNLFLMTLICAFIFAIFTFTCSITSGDE